MDFEPKIIGFFCNWCAYAAADLAGVMRLRYPPNLRIIRVMCSGRVDERLVLRAFELGADGVLIGGCHPGDCHYLRGNLIARRRMSALRLLLDAIGIGGERVRLEWLSASEGARLPEVVEDFRRVLKELGPNPLKRR